MNVSKMEIGTFSPIFSRLEKLLNKFKDKDYDTITFFCKFSFLLKIPNIYMILLKKK